MASQSLLLGFVALVALFAFCSAGELGGYGAWGYGNPWTGYWASQKGYGVGYPGYGHIFGRGYPGAYGRANTKFLEGYPEYDNGYGYGHPQPAYGGYGYGHEH
uniref:Sulfur globule protein CV3 n=1 Tax=Steinernema glaseri TaxID=37863 RepID=A0A1I7ZQA7_9BILA